jgi:UPF0755 protein
MLKKLKLIAAVFFVVTLNLANFYFVNIFVTKLDIKKEFRIDKDENFNSILSKIGVEKDIYMKIYLKLSRVDRKLKAGYYALDGRYTKSEIFNMLKKGSYRKIKITIPEGYTVYQISQLLVENNLMEDHEFYAILEGIEDFPYPTPDGNFEGYFFPETYFFNEEEDGEKVIRTMIGEFIKNYPPEKYPDREKFHENLTLASIVEREAGFDGEKWLISSVFHNRLKKRMKLQSDATVNYVFNYEKRRIFYKDLEVDSPYNTYKNFGLPPAPIGNPGRISIDVSINPVKTDYYYFVADGTGGHHFSKTYREHIEFQNKR